MTRRGVGRIHACAVVCRGVLRRVYDSGCEGDDGREAWGAVDLGS